MNKENINFIKETLEVVMASLKNGRSTQCKSCAGKRN